MKHLICIVAIIAWSLPLQAEPPSLDSLVTQLGAPEFRQRESAELQLIKLAQTNPKARHDFLIGKLKTETDPEIRLRLRRLLRTIAIIHPTKSVLLSKETLKERIWSLHESAPEKAQYTLNDGVLEYDSIEEPKEAFFFFHRFTDAAAKLPRLKFGAPPKRDPRRLILDAEIKVIEERHDRDGLAGVHLNLEDHLSSAGLIILEDGIFAYRHHKMIHRMDTTDRWHHYRFVIEGATQRIYVDDMNTPVFEFARTTTGGRHWATIGDATAGAGAIAQFRNVRFSEYDLAMNGKGDDGNHE